MLTACAVLALVLVTMNKSKSDENALKLVGRASKILAEKNKNSRSEAMDLLDKAVKTAKDEDQFIGRRAALCMQYEDYSCAIKDYGKLSGVKNQAMIINTKKLGDAYRYNNDTSGAIRSYEKIITLCGSNKPVCQGVVVDEIRLFITNLKENKPIEETS